MKRKSIISLLAGAALLCSVPSCMDLDETVYDKIPSDQFGKTDAEINAIVAPVYKRFRQLWPDRYMYTSECSGDMAITPTRRGGDWWDNGQYMELHLHTWTQTTNLIKDAWNSATESISTCNRVYKTISEHPNMDADTKARTLAEIRGVRAYWFYMMIDYWGNIPLVTDFNDTELPSLTDRKTAFNFVISELNEIKDILRDDVTGASYGKFTKGAAYMLLAKMYLNQEEWTGTANWQGVVDACNVVMGLPYRLEGDWKLNFAPQNQVSQEIILAIPFGASDGSDSPKNNMATRTLHYLDPLALGLSVGTWNGVCAQQDYIKLFDDADKRKAGTFLLGEMKDPSTGKVIMTAHNRPLIHTEDVRQIPNTERGGTNWGEVEQEDGGRCQKWQFPAGQSTEAMENDYAIFRLADAYLMKAEALVRMGKDNATATQLVNAIRSRGFGDDSHNYASVTLDNIALERKLEMAWEICSRQDCIRFGTFLNARYLKKQSEPYRKLFCIPLAAWQTNSKLVQNPGYPAFAL